MRSKRKAAYKLAAVLLAHAAALSTNAQAQDLQAQFDEGQAAYEAGNWKTAISAFEALLAALPADRRDGTIAAAVASRMGESQLALGNTAQAVASLTAADQIYRRLGTQNVDAQVTALKLGQLNERSGALSQAAEQYQRAYDMPEGDSPLGGPALGLARTVMFSDPAASRSLIDAALAAAQEKSGHTEDEKEELLANLYTIRGRASLSSEGPKAAKSFYDKALELTGITSRRVSLIDTMVRGEAAYADFLSDNRDEGIRKLLYTGAGRMEDDMPGPPAKLELPPCALTGPVHPDDMMIVEFAIGDDGRVRAVTPIYSSRPGVIEEAFLTAAKQSAWAQEQMAEISPFWRASLRAELRCEIDSERRSYVDYFRDMLDPFLPAKAQFDQKGQDIDVAAAVAAARRPDPAWLEHLLLAERSARASADQTEVLAGAIMDIVNTQNWPAARRALLWGSMSQPSARPDIVSGYRAAVMEKRAAANEMESVAALTLLALRAARAHEQNKDESDAIAAYREAIGYGLPANSAPVQFANLRLASIMYEEKQPKLASDYIRASGLAPNQCSLLDAEPVGESAGLSSSDYPHELLARGLGGYVVTNFAIRTEGRTEDARVTYAFPPLLFSEVAKTGASRMRFKKIYREGEAIGCDNASQGYRFRVAR